MIAAIALGSAVGGVTRYLLGLFVQRWVGAPFPVGTLLINVTGSILLGYLLQSAWLAMDVRPVMRAMLTVGFCGGYTTFSTFSYETAVLIEDGLYSRAAAYVVVSVVVSLLGTFLGFQMARNMIVK